MSVTHHHTVHPRPPLSRLLSPQLSLPTRFGGRAPPLARKPRIEQSERLPTPTCSTHMSLPTWNLFDFSLFCSRDARTPSRLDWLLAEEVRGSEGVNEEQGGANSTVAPHYAHTTAHSSVVSVGEEACKARKENGREGLYEGGCH